MTTKTLSEFINYNFLKPSLFSPTCIANHNLLKAVNYFADNYANGKLVDLGCGVKPYETLFKPHVDQYIGVDFNKTAKVNYGEMSNPDVISDINNTFFKDNSFNTLISTQVLEHLLHPSGYINECNRILKKNGFALFTVPLTYECHSKPFDYFRYTEFSLKNMFEDKFEIIHIKPLDNSLETINQLLIVSLLLGNFKNKSELKFHEKAICKIIIFTFVPFINILTRFLKKLSNNYDLCLNYSVIVKKK